MKFWKKLSIKFLTAIPVMIMLSSCFGDQTINNQAFDIKLSDIDMNNPGNTPNISVPIPQNNSSLASYIRKHAVSMVMTKNSSGENLTNEPTGSVGSGFIINVFQDKTDSSGVIQSSNYEKIIVGTNLHVAKNFFPNVDLKNVNIDNTPTITVPNANFYLGWMNWETTQVSGGYDNYNLYMQNSTQQSGTDDSVNSNSASENNFMKIPNADVKLLYTATNLRINESLFLLDSQINQFQELKNQFSATNWDDIKWVQSFDPKKNNPLINLPSEAVKSEWDALKIPSADAANNTNTTKTVVEPATPTQPDPALKNQYNFAVDFAVMEIDVPKSVATAEFSKMIQMMKQSGGDEYQALEVNRGFRISNSLEVPYFAVGGFPSLSQAQILQEEIDNAHPQFSVIDKSSNGLAHTLLPSEAFSQIQKDYSKFFTVSNLKSNLTVTNFRDLSFDNDSGSLSFNYDIVVKPTEGLTNFNYKKTLSVLINGGFKTASGSESKFTANRTQPPIRDGLPISKYLEAYVNGGTFSDQSIKTMANDLWNQKIYSNNLYYTNPKESVIAQNHEHVQNIVNYGNENFLGVGSKILVKGLDLRPGSSGSMAISDGWTIQDTDRTANNLVGIYKGVQEWVNPTSQNLEKTAVIDLLSSPFRYDLFQAKNNLSYPALCDVLNHKGITGELANSSQTCPVLETNS